MILPKDCTEKNILSDEVFEQIFEMTDPVEQAKEIMAFQRRAVELDEGLKLREQHFVKDFNQMLRAWKQIATKSGKRQRVPNMQDNFTEFDYFGNGTELYCGSWTANDDGVRTFNLLGEVLACYHPILPVERLENLETGEEQLLLAYKRNGKWKTHKVPKDVVSTASKITALSKYGVAVTSENAKALVRYLSDIENWNDNIIRVQRSTSKLGWLKDDFIPYDKLGRIVQ